MVVLYIFKGVGGFYFNPYGIVCLLAICTLRTGEEEARRSANRPPPSPVGLDAIPMCWIIYTKPQFFAGALLAMNGTGSLIVTEVSPLHLFFPP